MPQTTFTYVLIGLNLLLNAIVIGFGPSITADYPMYKESLEMSDLEGTSISRNHMRLKQFLST